MPQPTPYNRQADFTAEEATNPTAPRSGVDLDAEFDAAKVTLDDILRNLAKIQRDDGKLKNGVVGSDAIDAALLLLLGAGSQWTVRGPWAAGTAYAASDAVTVGTATYIALVTHVSADPFDASKWMLLFDSAGAIPADESVTAGKIADGAVTADKLGFDTLDLAGSVRGAAGVSAGTAPLGALMHAKLAAGDVHAKVERATDAQGAVGVKIIGSATWAVEQAAASTDLTASYNGAIKYTFSPSGDMTASGFVRAQGAQPTSGEGASLHFAGGAGWLTAYDYTATAWRDLYVRGKDTYIQSSGVTRIKAHGTGVDLTGVIKANGVKVGFLGIPQRNANTAYGPVADDVGYAIYSENTAAQTITIHPDRFTAEDVIMVINDGTNAITLAQGAGVVLRLAGTATTGNRTIAPGGWAMVKCVKSNRFFVSGPGVS